MIEIKHPDDVREHSDILSAEQTVVIYDKLKSLHEVFPDKTPEEYGWARILRTEGNIMAELFAASTNEESRSYHWDGIMYYPHAEMYEVIIMHGVDFGLLYFIQEECITDYLRKHLEQQRDFWVYPGDYTQNPEEVLIDD